MAYRDVSLKIRKEAGVVCGLLFVHICRFIDVYLKKKKECCDEIINLETKM